LLKEIVMLSAVYLVVGATVLAGALYVGKLIVSHFNNESQIG